MSNKLGGSNKPLLGDDDDDDDVEAGHVAAANVNNGGVHDLDEKDEAISAVDWFSRHKWKCLGGFVVVLIAVAVTLGVVLSQPQPIVIDGSSLANYQDSITQGQALCAQRINTPAISLPNAQRGILTAPVLITGATVWTGLPDDVPSVMDVLFYNGSIQQVQANIGSYPGATVVDGTGKHITPGLVDLHSHVGVYALPELVANLDGNELTDPTFPQLRSLDAYNPRDEAINKILRGGVTTSLVLPGSGNTMGGEAFVVKLNGSTVAQARVEGAPRYMKMACGENPKNVYGAQGKTPASRMGSAWVMRQRFELAKKLATAQDDWCANPSVTSRFPEDLSLNSLIALLRGSLILNVHCYTVWDMEMIIRLSHEFNFKIAAFHHAIEAWKFAPTLAEEGIAAAIFVDSWGFKDEGYYASAYAPSTLYAAGATVIFKTDHPVISGDTLMYEAAKATAYGFPQTLALSAVTINPATALNLQNRVGSIEVGKDADIVLWDRSPFLAGAEVDKVYLNGVNLVDNELSVPVIPANPISTDVSVTPPLPLNSQQSLSSYTITNAVIYTGYDDITYSELKVDNGLITCLSNSCNGTDYVFDLNGGTLIPGLVNFGFNLGIAEIEQESITQDGTPGTLDAVALDGVQFFSASHLVNAAFLAGVTSTVTPPMGSSNTIGQSSAFYTYQANVVADDVIIKGVTAVHVGLGQSAKGPSISAQILNLKNTLSSNATATIASVVSGALPLVLHAQNADTINSALRMLANFPSVRIIIYGAAEANLIIPQLVQANAAVILKGIHCFPELWEEQRCDSTTVVQLVEAGVPVAIGPQSIDWVRNLRWEAGLALAYGLSFTDALATVTSIPATLFGLPDVGYLTVGSTANFAAFNGNPFTLQSIPVLVGVGTEVVFFPKQL